MARARALPALLALSLLGVATCAPPPPPAVAASGARLDAALKELAALTEGPEPYPAVTRLVFSERDAEARSVVKRLMRDAGLSVREDSVGNIFGRLEGTDESSGAVGSGSHCDAIPAAGMYDGVVGVVGAIEALRALREAGFRPERPLEAVMFTSEEPTRFGLSCSGSRAMVGALDPAYLAGLPDSRRPGEEGATYAAAACAAGYGGCDGDHASLLQGARLADGYYDSFVELHIEQGPFLERDGLDIGVVTAIAAPAALEVDFAGDGGHAGAQLMPWRNDAGLAAAELALKVEELALGTGSMDTVATTGVMSFAPGAVNSVPRGGHMEVDIRDVDGERRDGVVAGIKSFAEEVAARRNVRLSMRTINQDPPASSGARVVEAAAAAAESLGLTYKRMPSRAYHDTLFMALHCDTAMVFIPCYKGYSHRPDEFAPTDAIVKGVNTLALTMAALSSSSSSSSSSGGGSGASSPPAASAA